MRSRLFLSAAATILLAACMGPARLTPGPHLTVSGGSELPPPTQQDLFTDQRPYRVGPFDQLSVNVFGIPELSQAVQVDASGRISLPLVGVVEAVGKTPGELAESIEQALRGRYVRDPQVTVNLQETVSQVITVDGQVQQPGLYPVIGRMTLMRAVATAHGTSEFARLSDVVVFRTVGNQQMAALYDLQAIRRGLYPDPEVYANDVVVVGDSPARRLFRDILQATPLLTTPIVALIRR